MLGLLGKLGLIWPVALLGLTFLTDMTILIELVLWASPGLLARNYFLVRTAALLLDLAQYCT